MFRVYGVFRVYRGRCSEVKSANPSTDTWIPCLTVLQTSRVASMMRKVQVHCKIERNPTGSNCFGAPAGLLLS